MHFRFYILVTGEMRCNLFVRFIINPHIEAPEEWMHLSSAGVSLSGGDWLP